MRSDALESKAMGAWMGAAIGDAMGGPVECQHAARIKRHYGAVFGLLPYRKPPGLMDLYPGYALHDAPGSITDDTFIRADFTRFFLSLEDPYDPEAASPDVLASWLGEFTSPEYWWKVARRALDDIADGKVKAAECGRSFPQGGGNGWWTPVGMLYAGRPAEAAAAVRRLAVIWKAPLELDLVSSIQAGVAAAMNEGARLEDILEAMFAACGSTASTLLERGVEVGRTATGFDDLVDKAYSRLLLKEAPLDADAPVPEPLDPLPYSDEGYSSVLLAEQVPLELAALTYCRGDISSVPTAVMLGRDCDSTATTVGSWIGALHGLESLPRDWVDTVQNANLSELDLMNLGRELIANIR